MGDCGSRQHCGPKRHSLHLAMGLSTLTQSGLRFGFGFRFGSFNFTYSLTRTQTRTRISRQSKFKPAISDSNLADPNLNPTFNSKAVDPAIAAAAAEAKAI